MTTTTIKTAAEQAGLTATIEGDEVHVGCTGMTGVAFMHSIIDDGATYLGAVKGRSMPLGCATLSRVVVRRFTA